MKPTSGPTVPDISYTDSIMFIYSELPEGSMTLVDQALSEVTEQPLKKLIIFL